MPNFSATALKRPAWQLVGLLKRVSTVEKSALLIIGLSAAALFAFASLADEVVEGDTRAFDEFVLLAFRSQTNLSDPVGPGWLEEMMRDFTSLGSIAVLASITLAVVGYLVLVHKRRVAMMVVGGVASGTLLSGLLKWVFARSRPDLVPHISEVYTQSFPSGHAMLSAIVYLTLGALLARTQAEPRVKIYLLGVAAAATFIVGLSRVYLGVHWPTDVLAGWAIGAGWAFLCWLVMLWLQSQGTIEPETAERDPDIRSTGAEQ
jgi:undecaprenyl-diphosphatase